MVGQTESMDLEQQLLIARANLRGYLMLMVRYAQDRGDTPAQLTRYLGEQVAPTWGRLRHCSAIEFAQALARLAAAGGDQVVTVREEGGIARLELKPPATDQDLLDAFQLRREVWHAVYYGQFPWIAAHLGLRCHHETDGEVHRFYFARLPRGALQKLSAGS